MTVSMTELMRAARNAFVTGAADGSWRVDGGVLTGDIPLEPGWIGIEGRGAFEVGPGGEVEGLRDGAWQGRLWLLDPPDDFLRLLEDVNVWLADQSERDGRSETIVETVSSGENRPSGATTSTVETVSSGEKTSSGESSSTGETSTKAISGDMAASGIAEPVVTRRRESFGAYTTETDYGFVGSSVNTGSAGSSGSRGSASPDAQSATQKSSQSATQSTTQKTTSTTTPASTLTSGTTRVTTTRVDAATPRWESVFAARMMPFRRMFPEVRL